MKSAYKSAIVLCRQMIWGFPNQKEGFIPSKKCPNCGLYNLENAIRCDCGYDFPSGQIADSFLSDAEQFHTKNKKAQEKDRRLLGGTLSIVGGIFSLYAIYTYLEASRNADPNQGVEALMFLWYCIPLLFIGFLLLIIGIWLFLHPRGRKSHHL